MYVSVLFSQTAISYFPPSDESRIFTYIRNGEWICSSVQAGPMKSCVPEWGPFVVVHISISFWLMQILFPDECGIKIDGVSQQHSGTWKLLISSDEAYIYDEFSVYVTCKYPYM